MTEIAKGYAERCGYEYNIEIINGIVGGTTHDKPALIANYLTKKWSVWMDADSMMLRPIDEVFEVDFDVAIPVRSEAPRNKKRYGAYLCAGLVIAHNTEPTRQFLAEWDSKQYHVSDQRNLNVLLDRYLEPAVYTRTGEVIDCGGLKLLLLDSNLYNHTDSLRNERWPIDEDAKIIHFIGRLQRDRWPQYEKLLC
jgi:hypothetical protein